MNYNRRYIFIAKFEKYKEKSPDIKNEKEMKNSKPEQVIGDVP